ncbi:MAG: cysteine hydrolase [Methanomassiliicoccales archaeon]|nr:cysteine hydrolase [Methanomassiliicoccales archaeon]NYT14895.1 cysteine hydrolase [Methanomassiliicoccales archaeon]
MDKAVVVIDMLNEFVYGKLGGERSRSVIPCIERLLDKARAKGIPVIYVTDAHEEDDLELEVWGEHAMKGTEDADIIPELEPLPGEIVLEKSTYFSFHDTGLDEILTDMGVKEVILCGLLTDICIKLAAAEAFVRNYSIVVPKGCVNSISQEAHEGALKEMADLYHAKIIDLEQVIN